MLRAPTAAKKILIVEDEPKTVAYLRKGLSEQGYAVDFASDGESGLHLAQTWTTTPSSSTSCCPGWTGSRCWSACASVIRRR
ncbi:hypothetical protein [Caulobacter hibisci]